MLYRTCVPSLPTDWKMVMLHQSAINWTLYAVSVSSAASGILAQWLASFETRGNLVCWTGTVGGGGGGEGCELDLAAEDRGNKKNKVPQG